MWDSMQFANQEALWLFLLIPVAIALFVYKQMKLKASVQYSNVGAFSSIQKSFKQNTLWFPPFLRVAVLSFLIIALARPQSTSKGQNITSDGISIVLALDISGSMRAEDFIPNRIEASKNLALEFIENRRNDVMGLVVFAGESFTQCPITTDHTVLKNAIKGVKSGMLEDGTAIGEGLATAIMRLKESETKSKVIILLTDGVNNAGSITPLTAGDIAKTFGIRVYTIGVGKRGSAPFTQQTPYGKQTVYSEVNIDEESLQSISDATDGKYFRATSNRKLQMIYAEIDKLEKTKIEVTEFRNYSEEYLPFALAAGLLLLLELVLRFTVYRILPV